MSRSSTLKFLCEENIVVKMLKVILIILVKSLSSNDSESQNVPGLSFRGLRGVIEDFGFTKANILTDTPITKEFESCTLSREAKK